MAMEGVIPLVNKTKNFQQVFFMYHTTFKQSTYSESIFVGIYEVTIENKLRPY